MSDESSITSKFEKFFVETSKGFLRLLHIGMGRRLGIFEYLNKKTIQSSEENKGPIISFTIEELCDNLNLNYKYLYSWLHLACKLGIFEINSSEERTLRTAPFINQILINSESPFYLGNLYSWFYKLAPMQESITANFKTGELITRLDWDILEEASLAGQLIGMRYKNLRIKLFSKVFKEKNRVLKQGGSFLEVGCGYGYNLISWAKMYKKLKIVGIDIDEKKIAHVNKLISEKEWNERIEAKTMPLNEYTQTYDEKKFDLISMNEVLHEMNPKDEYRKKVFEDVYYLLKDDGMVFVGESMIPDLFNEDDDVKWYEIAKKWDETSFGAKFYDEKSFRELISSTPFTQMEFVQDGEVYFWILQK